MRIDDRGDGMVIHVVVAILDVFNRSNIWKSITKHVSYAEPVNSYGTNSPQP